MINIYLHELKQYKYSTAIWIGSIILVSILFVSVWPAIEDQTENMQKVMESFPQAFKELVGLTDAAWSSLAGFYSVIFIYIALAGSIQAMHLGTAILSKERRNQTSEFLLVKPIGRSRILTAKLLAALTILIITNIIFIGATLLILNFYSVQESITKPMFMIMFTLFFLQLFFLALGLLTSVILKKIKSVIAISLPVVFVFYFIGMLEEVIGDEAIRYLTPFKYFDYEYIIANNVYETGYLILEAVLIILAVMVTYIIYSKKDV